ncbi:MAG: hypothetical protein JXA90_09580, partial [Planctomycetes bacterium]|nr:hypothetical protein [Planctomycetota bacterium]
SIDLTGRPEVEPALFTNRFGSPMNRTALPVHVRYRGSLAWTKCPFQLVKRLDASGAKCVSGVDYLLAYWMARRILGDPERTAWDEEPARVDTGGHPSR